MKLVYQTAFVCALAGVNTANINLQIPYNYDCYTVELSITGGTAVVGVGEIHHSVECSTLSPNSLLAICSDGCQYIPTFYFDNPSRRNQQGTHSLAFYTLTGGKIPLQNNQTAVLIFKFYQN